MNLIRFKAFLFVAVFSCSNILFSQGFTSDQIDSLVNAAMKKNPHAGIAIVVVKDGKIIHEKGYGYSSLETKAKVNEHTRFGIASNSKAFTSAALAMLVDEGKLKWTDKVVDYIPEFKMYDPYVTANFTIADLLSHHSGLGLGAGDLLWFPDGNDYTIEEIMTNFQYQKPVSGFRTEYAYNNLLFIVAGEVVVRISGMSWSDFVETRIMKPLGMTESAGKYERLADKSNVAYPHSTIDGKLVQLETMDISKGEAAAGIYASVHDLSKWLLLHLNNGKNGEDVLIAKKNHDALWTPNTITGFHAEPNAPYKTHYEAYGLGWEMDDKNGYTVISHGGGLPGMLSKTRIIPELDLGIIVLTNADPGGYSYEFISRSIADSYLGLEDMDWISRISPWMESSQQKADSVMNATWDKVKKAKTNDLKLDNFVGSYNDNWFGKMEITLKDGGLYLYSVRSPKLSGKMLFYEDNTFVVKWNYTDMECNAFAHFVIDENGKATGFTMEGISPKIDFSFDFHDLNLKRIN